MSEDWETAKPPRAGGKVDWDRLSIAELEARIADLEAEIAACRRAIDAKRGHRSEADSLFRR